MLFYSTVLSSGAALVKRSNCDSIFQLSAMQLMRIVVPYDVSTYSPIFF